METWYSTCTRIRGGALHKACTHHPFNFIIPGWRTDSGNGEDVFPSAPGPSAVSGWPDNPRIFDRFLTDTVASVARRSTAASVRLQGLFPFLSAPQMARCVRARAATMCGGIRTRPKGMQIDCHAFDAAVL